MVDFKDRVRPLAKDLALMDSTRQFQKHNVNELLQEQREFVETISKVQSEIEKEALEEGYSSREIEEGGVRRR